METFLKDIILPSNLVVFMLAAGLVFFVLRAKRAAWSALFSSMALYLIFALGPVSYLLLGSLEYRYPAFGEDVPEGVRKIVVLTGDGERDPMLPLSSMVNSSSSFRLIEAARIFQKGKGMEVIITGFGDVPALMKEALVAIGLPEESIAVEGRSLNTFESARNLGSVIGKSPFVLVTSAGHMPRSMMVFSKLGMNPVPAPTDFLTHRNFMAVSYAPRPLHLRNSDLAAHEYAAMAWYWLLGRL